MADDANADANTFAVTAIWDAEAGIFFSQSDIPGLHVEATSFDEFVALVRDLAPEVIADNLPAVAGPISVRVEARRDLVLPAA